jgi:hypothetical protein
MEPQQTYPFRIQCLVALMLLLSEVYGFAPLLAWAAVYECFDAAGKVVLTNRPAQLHRCHVVSGNTASALAPPEAQMLPQGSRPPTGADKPSPPPYVPLPADKPTELQGASIGASPAPNSGPSSSPPPNPPCARAFNPLNPLSAPPCVRSNQSGAQSPGAVPAPSP